MLGAAIALVSSPTFEAEWCKKPSYCFLDAEHMNLVGVLCGCIVTKDLGMDGPINYIIMNNVLVNVVVLLCWF